MSIELSGSPFEYFLAVRKQQSLSCSYTEYTVCLLPILHEKINQRRLYSNILCILMSVIIGTSVINGMLLFCDFPGLFQLGAPIRVNNSAIFIQLVQVT